MHICIEREREIKSYTCMGCLQMEEPHHGRFPADTLETRGYPTTKVSAKPFWLLARRGAPSSSD